VGKLKIFRLLAAVVRRRRATLIAALNELKRKVKSLTGVESDVRIVRISIKTVLKIWLRE
jgi:hypothetical protein